jgi:CubicO group peptidase (beta-lactamase class C family)
MIKNALFVTLTFFSLQLAAQYAPSGNDSVQSIEDKIDAYLLSAVKAYKFNGVALVAKEGKILFHKAYGFKDVASQTYNDTATRFPILSITKSFTAMVLLKLQELGKLSLKDPLSKYMPDYPEGSRIKLEHLITHSSGIFNFTDLIGEEDSAIVCHPVTKQRVTDLFRNEPLAFEPGKGFAYNNSGYFLAGMVIEKVTGKPYEQNVRELIFKPLGMQHSGFDYINLPAGFRATGYQFLNAAQQKPYPFYDSTVGYAAGAIYSTTTDLFKWTQAIAAGRLLSAASWKAAFTPRAANYGYGFQVGQFGGKNFIKHSGGYPGYVSEFIYYPQEKTTIILLKNSGNYGEDIWPVTMGLSSILFGTPYDLWRPRTAVTLPEDVLKQKEGTYALGDVHFVISVKEGQLLCAMPGGELPLVAESDDSFYFENFNSHFRFIKGSNGAVEKMVFHENGSDYEAKKIK